MKHKARYLGVIAAVTLLVCSWLVVALIQATGRGEDGLWETLLRPDTAELWLRSAVVLLLVFLGAFGLAIHGRRRRARRLLARSELILDAVWNEVFVFDAISLRFVQVNEAARMNLGYTAQELYQMTPVMLMPSWSPEQFRSLVKGLNRGAKQQVVFETHLKRKDGNEYPITGRIQLSPQGSHSVLVMVIQDISEHQAHVAQMQRRRMYDTLTDLPNRHLFDDRLGDAIAVAKRESQPLALILIDIDRLRDIKNTLGPRSTDIVLQEIGLRLQNVLRDGDTVARLGGGEFALALPGVGIDYAVEVAKFTRQQLTASFLLDEVPLHVDVDMGIVLFPDHGDDSDLLLQRADVAVGQARKEKVDYVIYDPERDPFSLRRLTLFGSLRDAIKKGDFVLHYQPKVDFASGDIVSVEALVRWLHPQEGMLSPMEFIPLAEHTGLIKPLTAWVLNEAIRQCHTCKQQGLNARVAVNLSAADLQQLQLPDQVAETLAQWGMQPHDLVLEITESAIMDDPERAMQVLARLDEMGIELSIDDFGTGYSSLAYLRKLPVREVKIDQSFVFGLASNDDDATIVHSIINLAHDLGLKVVAEGIESQQVWDVLAGFGCDTGQGSYVSPPIAKEELIAWMHSRRVGAVAQKPSHINCIPANNPAGLENIPGIGDGRQKALLSYFGSLKKIQQASLDELATVKGIGPAAAKRIHAYLH